jgi:protein SCO1/2
VLDVREGLGRIRRLTSIGWTPLPDRTNAADMAGNVLAPGDAIPDAALVDQADRRRSLSDWRGYWVLVTFVYTRCPLPTFCPLMDQNFSTLQRAIAEQATLRARVRLVSISFDPAHDTPAVLSAHARRLKADPALWTFLTGDEVTVDRVAARFGVGVLRAAEPGGEITHNLRTSLVDPEGRLAHVFTGNEWTPGAVLASVRRFVTP